MQLFVMICFCVVLLFGISLLISTLFMGTNILVGLQVIMGSLRYSKEVDDKVDIALGKIDAGLYHVFVNQHTIELYSKDKYPNLKEDELWKSTADLELWISNKYYSYGNIYRIDGKSIEKITNKRPSIRLIKQMIQLEKTRGNSTSKIKKTKKEKKVVLG